MRKHKGFTIIEVVLVLAVAGLIFAMVFMALPALWASQRDTARREDVLTFIRNLKSFQTNNSRGALPEGNFKSEQNNIVTVVGNDVPADKKAVNCDELSWCGFYRDYFGGSTDGDSRSYQDPDGTPYNWAIMWCKPENNSKVAGTPCGDTTNTGNGHNLGQMYNGKFEDNDYYLRIVISATCDGDHAVLSANNRRAAALYRLEGSGVYCENI